jgi:tRNA-modifying protein YgfZ
MDHTQWQQQIQAEQNASRNPSAQPWPIADSLLIDLSNHDLLYIHGADAHAFLQGQLTCQMDDLPNGKSHLAAHCNPKGRVLSLMRIHAWQDGFLLSLPAGMAEHCQKALKPYIMRSQVHMKIVNHDVGQIAVVCGDENPLLDVYTHVPTQIDEVITQAQHHAVTLMRHRKTQYLIQAPYAELLNIWQACEKNCTIGQGTDWQYQQYLQRIATIYPKTSGLFTPHMLHLPEHDAVCLQKGCFCGQEIIARTHYRGQNKRFLSRWHGPEHTDVKPGDTIYDSDGAKAGTIIDALKVAHSHTACLAVVHERCLQQPLSFDREKNTPCTPVTEEHR